MVLVTLKLGLGALLVVGPRPTVLPAVAADHPNDGDYLIC